MFISMNEAVEFLKNCDNVYILTHQSPDGDCTGAGFALHDILRNMDKKSAVLCCDEFPDKFNFMTDTENNADFTPETFITVDVADKRLLGKYEEIYGDKINLCIDHHISNKDYAERTLLEADSAAACQVLYRLSCAMGVELSDYAACCIYTGIATDTGCFKFENAGAETHRIIAEIMYRHKLKYADINRKMFDIKSKARMILESRFINLMEEYLDNRLIIAPVTIDIINEIGIDYDEFEGLAPMTIELDGTEVGVLMKEREPNIYRCSFRSANDVNVSEICKILDGGGHAKAAGCTIEGCTLEEAKRRIIEAVRKVMP